MMIIFNPTAGRRRTDLLWRVLDLLAQSGTRLEIAETRYAGHAALLAREAASAGARMVVVAGGDGTIAEVANGLQSTECCLGIIPLGTANVFAQEFGLSFSPRAMAAAFAFSHTRVVWPGLATGPGGINRCFVQMLGVGFDAQVVHRLPLALKRVFGRAAYVLQTARELSRYRFPRIDLRLDGTPMQACSVIVTKGHFYAGSYILAPGATPAQKGFFVVTFDRAGPAATVLYGLSLPLNLISRMPGVRVQRAEVVEIATCAAPAQVDGDPMPQTEWLQVTDAPVPLRVVVSQ